MVEKGNTQKSFITQMSDEDKVIFIKIMVALARTDKDFDENEKAFIKDTAIIFGLGTSNIDEITKPMSNDEVIEAAAKITNREVALQLIKEACFLANSDGSLSDEEIIFIGNIGQAMNIELEKIEEISQWVLDRIIWLERGKIIFEQV